MKLPHELHPDPELSLDKRRMCPNCRAFITSADRTCPYCGQPVGPRAIDVREPGAILGGLIPQAHFTTVIILLVNLGLFLAEQFMAKSMGENVALYGFGAKWGPAIYGEHQWWRLVTAGFMHGGWIHIGMNSWVLYDLGAQVEQVYGTPRFLAIYFAGTVAGFYLSLVLNPQIPSVGASAGITGLIGAMIAFGVANRSTVGRAIRDFYAKWVLYVLAIGFIGGFGMDNWAHLGGAAGGFVLGYIAGTPVRSSYTKEAFWRAAGALCVVITLYCFWMMYRSFPSPNALG